MRKRRAGGKEGVQEKGSGREERGEGREKGGVTA